MTMDLSERAQRILNALIRMHVRDGEPVGSKKLVAESGLGLSSATVRNVLADLEEAGLIMSPHTSAGRIPTGLGYRFFVDSVLAASQPGSWQDTTAFQALIEAGRQGEREGLLDRASALLSDMTRCAAVISHPRAGQVILRHLEFVPLSEQRILVILVVNEQEIENRIIQTDKLYTRSELEAAANYLNAHFVGQDLMTLHAHLSQALLSDLKELRQTMELIQKSLQVTQNLVQSKVQQGDFVLFGQAHLLPLAESQGAGSIAALYQAFSEKKDILHLLESCLHADGIQIFIGEESGYQPLNACSLIGTHYGDPDGRVGVLGVIGPKRLPYDKVIPVVDMAAKCLSLALNFDEKPPS